MTHLLTKTISQIVTECGQTALVFEKYHLDFCCKGKRPLQEALKEMPESASKILFELNEHMSRSGHSDLDFQKISLSRLIDYIVSVHHTYVRNNLHQITACLGKVATKHGDSFPYMKDVYLLFEELEADMSQHLLKEEKILFPRIKQIEVDPFFTSNPDLINAPIDIMEEEHEAAGELMEKIRVLTNDYEAPENACTTFKLTMSLLKEFEVDLHKHVHLENNILFPRAVEMLNEGKIY